MHRTNIDRFWTNWQLQSESHEFAQSPRTAVLLESDSIEEIEIRAATLFVTAQLTEEINKVKQEEEKIIIPQLDFKLWTDFHAEQSAHHLTKTIMY